MTRTERYQGSQAYALALRRHLCDPGELSLTEAYEFGRRALEDGTSIIDVVSTHEQALSARGLTAAEHRLAMSFLLQCLAPFEMASSRYREANDELRALNAELEQRVAARTADLKFANDELEAFAYSVSHDLRAPLRAVDGFSQVLLDTYRDQLDEQGRDYLSRVRAGARRMGTMIDELLELSRVSRAQLRHQAVDLSTLARRIAEEMVEADPGRRVELVVTDGITAQGDPELLRIVLENLLSNAWKFTSTRAEARVEVGQTEHAGHAAYFVRDNGVGFDMAHAGQLFAPFQRLHRADEFPGVGIGLVSVQRIVSRHGGRIWAEAEPDRGATFVFTLEPDAATT